MRATTHLPLALLLAACAGSPTASPTAESDPAIEQTFRDRQQAVAEARARATDLARVMIDLDRSIDAYVQALNNRGVPRADKNLLTIEFHVREVVKKNYQRLLSAASDSSHPGNQGIALAALGFADGREAMPVILQGAQLSDDFRVNSAVLGLAILQDPDTPPGVLIAVIENPERPEPIRIQAAWALYRIQVVATSTSEIVEYWRKMLARSLNATPALILTSGIRGMGLTRDPANAEAVNKYASHPVAKVRWNTAIALGRMLNEDSVDVLLALLGPAEDNANVRLAARKALQALAGGIDRDYDVDEWRKVFKRK